MKRNIILREGKIFEKWGSVKLPSLRQKSPQNFSFVKNRHPIKREVLFDEV